MMEYAKGKVLFIDEAYSIFTGSPASHQVISEIVKTMEDEGSKFILILAGYGAEIESLIACNPGLDSRMKYKVQFSNYNLEEMVMIFRKMAEKQRLSVSPMADEKIKTYLVQEALKKGFGNARTVRTLLDFSIDRHNVAIQKGLIGKEEESILTVWDIPDI